MKNWYIVQSHSSFENKVAQEIKTNKLHKMLAKKFNFKKEIRKIEVYDNSHLSGREAIGSYIVANQHGFLFNEYRKFNIKEAKTNDDYGMMKEVLRRRLLALDKNNFPDLIIIDVSRSYSMELPIPSLSLES